MLDIDDHNLIALTSSASLDRSPKKNWVENAGNLPPYVRKLARAIEKNGKSLSSAIAIAISRIKVWAAGGGGVDADTKAKAVKALAQWNALKAKNKAGKVVKASHAGGTYLMLSDVSSFNTEIVRIAWNEQDRARRRAEKSDSNEVSGYSWIKELWTDHIIVEDESYPGPGHLLSVPYTVRNNEVEFGEPTAVEMRYVPVSRGIDLTLNEQTLLADVI